MRAQKPKEKEKKKKMKERKKEGWRKMRRVGIYKRGGGGKGEASRVSAPLEKERERTGRTTHVVQEPGFSIREKHWRPQTKRRSLTRLIAFWLSLWPRARIHSFARERGA